MLVEVDRGGLVESVHQVSVAAVDPSGRLLLSSGDTERPFHLRSAAKPFQAHTAQRLGASLPPEHLAVAAASHDGLPVHLSVVARILSDGGLAEADLACPPAWPLSRRAADLLASAGQAAAPRPIWHNCSGKHAAMLRACRSQGWETAGYADPGHPLQAEVSAEIEAVFGPGPSATDGCGVPTFRSTSVGLARGYASLAADPRFDEVRTAMGRYPALVSGSGNVDAVAATWLHAVAKRGAEGCLGVGLPGFGGIGIKVWDGGARAVGPALLAMLDELGWVPPATRDRLAPALEVPVLGGGAPVGSVRPRSPWR